MRRWDRGFLVVASLAVFGWWLVLTVSNTVSFFRGDKFAGVVALIMVGVSVGAVIAGISAYRRFRLEWNKRVGRAHQEVR